jgi:hypothetical protein
MTGTACRVGQLHDDHHVGGALAEHHHLGRRDRVGRFVAAMLFAHRGAVLQRSPKCACSALSMAAGTGRMVRRISLGRGAFIGRSRGGSRERAF